MHHTQELNVNPHNKYRVQIRHEKIKIIEIIAYDIKGRTLFNKKSIKIIAFDTKGKTLSIRNTRSIKMIAYDTKGRTLLKPKNQKH